MPVNNVQMKSIGKTKSKSVLVSQAFLRFSDPSPFQRIAREEQRKKDELLAETRRQAREEVGTWELPRIDSDDEKPRRKKKRADTGGSGDEGAPAPKRRKRKGKNAGGDEEALFTDEEDVKPKKVGNPISQTSCKRG